MARLETLVLASVARLVLTLTLSTPVSFKVTGSGTSVAATAALEFTALSVQSATTAAASAIDGHALAAAVTSTSSAA
jgi:type IV secretory pathway TrbL component